MPTQDRYTTSYSAPVFWSMIQSTISERKPAHIAMHQSQTLVQAVNRGDITASNHEAHHGSSALLGSQHKRPRKQPEVNSPYLLLLPYELFLTVIECLNLIDFVRLRRTCQQLGYAISMDYIRKELSRQLVVHIDQLASSHCVMPAHIWEHRAQKTPCSQTLRPERPRITHLCRLRCHTQGTQSCTYVWAGEVSLHS